MSKSTTPSEESHVNGSEEGHVLSENGSAEHNAIFLREVVERWMIDGNMPRRDTKQFSLGEKLRKRLFKSKHYKQARKYIVQQAVHLRNKEVNRFKLLFVFSDTEGRVMVRRYRHMMNNLSLEFVRTTVNYLVFRLIGLTLNFTAIVGALVFGPIFAAEWVPAPSFGVQSFFTYIIAYVAASFSMRHLPEIMQFIAHLIGRDLGDHFFTYWFTAVGVLYLLQSYSIITQVNAPNTIASIPNFYLLSAMIAALGITVGRLLDVFLQFIVESRMMPRRGATLSTVSGLAMIAAILCNFLFELRVSSSLHWARRDFTKSAISRLEFISVCFEYNVPSEFHTGDVQTDEWFKSRCSNVANRYRSLKRMVLISSFDSRAKLTELIARDLIMVCGGSWHGLAEESTQLESSLPSERRSLILAFAKHVQNILTALLPASGLLVFHYLYPKVEVPSLITAVIISYTAVKMLSLIDPNFSTGLSTAKDVMQATGLSGK